MNVLKYPKRYATIINYDRDNYEITVKFDDDDSVQTLSLRWRNGKGWTGSNPMGFCHFKEGVRIKVYKELLLI